MRKIACVLVSVLFVLFSSPLWAAVEGNLIITIELGDIQNLLESFKAQMVEELAGELGGELPELDEAMLSAIPTSISVTGSIFIQGENMRMTLDNYSAFQIGDEQSPIPETVILVNHSDKKVYQYNPDTREGFVVDVSGADAVDMTESGGLIGNRNYKNILKGADVTTVGSRVVNGVECTGYRVKIDDPGSMVGEVNMWVSDKLDFPIAVRVEIMGMKIIWEIKDLNTVPDRSMDFFRPPPGTKLESADISNMGMMPGMGAVP